MSLLDKIIATIVPHDCLACGVEGGLLCSKCLAKLPGVPERCYRCHATSAGWLTCPACRPHTAVHRVQAATLYGGLAKNLVWRLKSSGAQAAAKVMAGRMVDLIQPDERPIIVSIPTATSRVRQRGYDQAYLLARQLARQAGLPWLPALARSGQAHQVGSNREQRRHQLHNAYRVTQARFVRGAHLLLVDDIVTTGATLEAAANVLQAAGAARIDAIAFAQTSLK